MGGCTYQLVACVLEVMVVSKDTHRSAVVYNVLQDICSRAVADVRWVNRHCVCMCVWVYGQSVLKTIIQVIL